MHEHKEKDLPPLKQFQMFIYDTIHAEWLNKFKKIYYNDYDLKWYNTVLIVNVHSLNYLYAFFYLVYSITVFNRILHQSA